MATRNDNKLYVWGLNTSGQLGLNDRISKSSPVQLGTNQAYTPPNMYSVPTQIGTSSWTQVSANFNSTFVIDPNNVLYEWGFNDNRPLIPAITSVGYSAVTVSNGFNHFGFTK
jgi:alpha-tubulin suppressor-like RCC1 family protein